MNLEAAITQNNLQSDTDINSKMSATQNNLQLHVEVTIVEHFTGKEKAVANSNAFDVLEKLDDELNQVVVDAPTTTYMVNPLSNDKG